MTRRVEKLARKTMRCDGYEDEEGKRKEGVRGKSWEEAEGMDEVDQREGVN